MEITQDFVSTIHLKGGYEHAAKVVKPEVYLAFHDHEFNPVVNFDTGFTLYDHYALHPTHDAFTLLNQRYLAKHGRSYTLGLTSKVMDNENVVYLAPSFLKVKAEICVIKGAAALIEYVEEQEHFFYIRHEVGLTSTTLPADELKEKLHLAFSKQQANMREFGIEEVRGNNMLNEEQIAWYLDHLDLNKFDKVRYSGFAKTQKWVWLRQLEYLTPGIVEDYDFVNYLPLES